MHSHLLHYVIKLNGPGPNAALGYSHFYYSSSPLIPLSLPLSLLTSPSPLCRELSRSVPLAMSIDFTPMTRGNCPAVLENLASRWTRRTRDQRTWRGLTALVAATFDQKRSRSGAEISFRADELSFQWLLTILARTRASFRIDWRSEHCARKEEYTSVLRYYIYIDDVIALSRRCRRDSPEESFMQSFKDLEIS